MEAKSASVPGPIPSIRNHWLAGELALLRGDAARALSELDEAATLLPRRGIFTGFIRRPYHVPVWYAMASAHAADGDDAAAHELFTAIVSSPSERLVWPVLYVRSYFWLAEIDVRRGDDERAREHFARFLAHWNDGDIDGEKVREARTWLN
jgi:hypothetical protein